MDEFKKVLEEAERAAIGKINGSLSAVISNKQPVAVTRFGAVDAYIIPESIIRELITKHTGKAGG